jgi:hypothetical protein
MTATGEESVPIEQSFHGKTNRIVARYHRRTVLARDISITSDRILLFLINNSRSRSLTSSPT